MADDPKKAADTLQLDEEAPDTLQLDDETSEGEKPEHEVEQLPGSTPRLRAATGGKAFKPPTRFEQEHTPEETGAWARTKQFLGDVGHTALGIAQAGGSALAEGPFAKPGQVSDMAMEYARRRAPNTGQEGMPGARSVPYSALATFAGAQGVDPSGMEEAAEHGDPTGVMVHAAGQAAVPAGAEALRIPAVGEAAKKATKTLGRVPDYVVRGTPISDEGRRAAALEQAMKVKKPAMGELEYAQQIQDVMPEIERIARDNAGQIKTPRQGAAAISNRVAQIEAPVGQHLDQIPDAQQTVPNPRQMIQQKIIGALDNGPVSYTPAEKNAALKWVDELMGDQDTTTAKKLERDRRRLNEEADAYYSMDTKGQRAANADAVARGQRTAANAIRDVLYGDGANPGELERLGVQVNDTEGNPVTLRDMRKTVGKLLEVRDHFEDAITRAEDQGKWSAWKVAKSGPSLAAGGITGLFGQAAGGPWGALFGLLAGEGGKIWANYRSSPNIQLNTAKMFRNLASVPERPTLETTTTMPRPLGAARALPAPAVQMPGPVNVEGSPIEGGRWVTPKAALPPVEPLKPTFLREIPRAGATTSGLGRVEAPQLPTPRETNIPPEVEPQFAREEVQPLGTAGERAPETQLGTVGRQGVRQAIRGGLPEEAPARAIQDQIDELRLREKDLRKQGNTGAANAIRQRIAALEAQVPEGFEESRFTPTNKPLRLGKAEEGTLGKAASEAEKKKSPEGLGKAEVEEIPYQKTMPIPKRMYPGSLESEASTHHHELAHAIVGTMDGFDQFGIVSHRGITQPRGGAIRAAALFDLKQFRRGGTNLGDFDPAVLADKADKLSDLFAAGAAANELIDNIPRNENQGLHGDRRLAYQLFEALGAPPEKWGGLFDAAIDRAKEKLSKPGITDIIKEEAGRREENLPVEYHYSKNRVAHIVNRIRGLSETPTSVGNETASSGAGHPGGEEAVSGAKSQSAETSRAKPEKLKPFKAPKPSFEFQITAGDNEPRRVTIEAATRRKAFDEVMKRKYLAEGEMPYNTEYKLLSEKHPEVQSIYSQTEEPGPLRKMVSDKEAEARVNRKLKREEGVGSPKSGALVLKGEDGKTYVFGDASTDQILDRWQSHLDPETIKKWRDWYPDISKQFRAAYGEGAKSAKNIMAWLGSQQNTSPSGGLMNVERATDILSGQKKIKSAGIAENNIMSMLQGKIPKEGYGAKLHDFVDSAFGRKTRTVMGDDPRGGEPAVVDVHGARGMGFVDETLKKFVEKKFGKEAASKLTEDLSGAPTETQYEAGSEKMNQMAQELNRRNFMGGGWDANQVQAVDWASMIRQLGREPELPESIFNKNTRRMSYEVKFGQDSPYAKKFPNLGDLEYAKSLGITKDVAQKAMEMVRKEAGGHVLRSVYGPGGWMESVSPSAGTEILSSPEAAERATNMLGYLLQQDAVITSRPQLSGAGHAYEIIEPGGQTLSDPEKVTRFWNAFREAYPKAEGFMPVDTPDGTGIRILKVRGHFSAKDVAALDEAASKAADRVNIGHVKTSHGPADVHMASNDWKANPDGKGYLSRIKEIGRPGVQGRLRNELAPAIERAIKEAFKKHVPEQAQRGGSPSPQAGKRLAAK